MRACKTCDYFAPERHTHSTGRCRRHPPCISRDVERLEEGWRGEWPFVLQGDWCGEYIRKASPVTGVRVRSVSEVDR